MNSSIGNAGIQDLTPVEDPVSTPWGPLPDEVGNPARHANRLKKEKAALSKRLEALEDEIAELEDEKAKVGAALCEPEAHSNPDRMRELAGEMARVEDGLAGLMDRWESLSGEIGELDEALDGVRP